MPGPWVKDWPMYEALKKQGKSKASAARITNAAAAKKKGKKKLRFKGKGKKKPMRFRRPEQDSMNAEGSALTA